MRRVTSPALPYTCTCLVPAEVRDCRGGALATTATHHIAGGDAAFSAEVQACYEQWDPATPPGLRLPTGDEIPFDSQDLVGSGQFGPATLRRYEWELAYSAARYLETLLTYSGHCALAPEARNGLLACITALIESHYRGHIRKRYLSELRVAYRT